MDSGETDYRPLDPERSRRPPQWAASEVVTEHRDPVGRLTGAIGNRGFGQLVARMRDGEGILPTGVVHPDVESAIAASRGRGRPLDHGVSERLESTLGESIGDVRVHTGDHAAAMARAVSARAFTVGSDIFFASGEYSPGTSSGNELLAHELTHVVQQRGAATSGPLTVSQPGDVLEREADAVARDLTSP